MQQLTKRNTNQNIWYFMPKKKNEHLNFHFIIALLRRWWFTLPHVTLHTATRTLARVHNVSIYLPIVNGRDNSTWKNQHKQSRWRSRKAKKKMNCKLNSKRMRRRGEARQKGHIAELLWHEYFCSFFSSSLYLSLTVSLSLFSLSLCLCTSWGYSWAPRTRTSTLPIECAVCTVHSTI